jgi:ferrous iron transport protein B
MTIPTHTSIILRDLKTDQQGYVRQLTGGHQLVQRLLALGFTPGVPVKILRSSEHGPILVSIRGTQVALGHLEAENILISVSDVSLTTAAVSSAEIQVTIALAGQPNVGKSTIFNALTGMNQHVGNWIGKTVERKSGEFTHENTRYNIVDLPGTYSLTANSDEERIARDFILRERPDLVIAVVDAATLERNMYLISELLLLPSPVILALNMMDVAAREGIQVEAHVLETALGIPVVPMSASRGQGIAELMVAVKKLLSGEFQYQPNKPSILPNHQNVLDQVKLLISKYVPPIYPENWVSLKLLEGDTEITEMMLAEMPQSEWQKTHTLLYQHEDAILDIAGARYEWIARMIRAAVVQPSITQVGLTARLDRTLTHPLWGTLILAGILGLVFFFTYSIGAPIQAWLAGLVSQLADTIRLSFIAFPPWLVEMLAGGILGGLGMVLTFLPILVIFFAILGFLEDTGYLARAAYLTDRWMHQMGLHGKSFIPILLGFGCNVPAILGTRIIESRKARLLTILLIPLIPCTARMAVVTVLAPLFFAPAMAAWVSWGLVAGNILLLAALGLVLHRFAFNNEHTAFIMELPLYHIPNLRTIGMYIWQNIVGFLEKAGKVILVASLVVWALSYFPGGNINTSWLAEFGKLIEPVGRWMGLPWPALVALLTSIVAKENTIATLGILYGNLTTSLPIILSKASSLAMLVFQMLFIPCIATVAAIRQESRSVKWTVFSVLLMLVLSLGLSTLVFRIGRLIFPGG